MGGDQYSFRTSDGTGTAADILSIQSRIGETLDAIDQALADLVPAWEATEADSYQEVMASWSEGARGLRSVLTDVREALLATRDGNTELRTAIQGVLDETS